MGAWAILDAAGKVIGTHIGDNKPPDHPGGSSVVEIPEIESGLVISLYNSGKTVEIDQENIKANGAVVGRMSK